MALFWATLGQTIFSELRQTAQGTAVVKRVFESDNRKIRK
jgi:hypothetical protein